MHTPAYLPACAAQRLSLHGRAGSEVQCRVRDHPLVGISDILHHNLFKPSTFVCGGSREHIQKKKKNLRPDTCLGDRSFTTQISRTAAARVVR
jgi:hypothetical protein